MSKWACPKCGAGAHKHGKGGADACEYKPGGSDCEGLICECNDNWSGQRHGEVDDDPCEEANCYHCGWGGRLPVSAINPKRLMGWQKKAWEAGWRPKP